jgi:hypothetical protein
VKWRYLGLAPPSCSERCWRFAGRDRVARRELEVRGGSCQAASPHRPARAAAVPEFAVQPGTATVVGLGHGELAEEPGGLGVTANRDRRRRRPRGRRAPMPARAPSPSLAPGTKPLAARRARPRAAKRGDHGTASTRAASSRASRRARSSSSVPPPRDRPPPSVRRLRAGRRPAPGRAGAARPRRGEPGGRAVEPVVQELGEGDGQVAAVARAGEGLVEPGRTPRGAASSVPCEAPPGRAPPQRLGGRERQRAGNQREPGGPAHRPAAAAPRGSSRSWRAPRPAVSRLARPVAPAGATRRSKGRRSAPGSSRTRDPKAASSSAGIWVTRSFLGESSSSSTARGRAACARSSEDSEVGRERVEARPAHELQVAVAGEHEREQAGLAHRERGPARPCR